MREPHGGNIYLLAEELGISESRIIDFSASINPLGVPESVQSAMRENMKDLFNYPDPDTKRLRMKISERLDIDPSSIICGNGSTELIYLVVRALRPARVLIPAPTFSEYERAVKIQGAGCRGHGSDMAFFRLEKEDNFDIKADEFIDAMQGESDYGLSSSPSAHPSHPFDMAFLCNPNNPTGRLIKREDMLKIAGAAKSLRCTLVVDEAFMDFCPDASIAAEVENNPYLIVLRSLTKFYALSGLRVGYAVLSPSLMDTVKEAREPWTVNTLAQIAGIAALDDETYKTETFRVIEKEKRAMEKGFRRMGISCLPSPVNYYLLQFEQAVGLTSSLKKKGILVRDCSNFPGLDSSYIRVAVKSGSANVRLLEEISSCVA